MDEFLSPQNNKVLEKAGYIPTKDKKLSTVVFSFLFLVEAQVEAVDVEAEVC